MVRETKRVLKVITLVVFAVFLLVMSCAAANRPADALTIQRSMKSLISYLDSSAYRSAVPLNDYIVLIYKTVKERVPEAVEFYTVKNLFKEKIFKRSDLLAILLNDQQERASGETALWNSCRQFLAKMNGCNLENREDIRADVNKLSGLTNQDIVRSLKMKETHCVQDIQQSPGARDWVQPENAGLNEEYNIYFGFLHAHCGLSDGQGSAIEAYTYARDTAKLDFFALTDHGEMLVFWPWQNKWQELKKAAQDSYKPGSFVSLWGFEWSSPILGHVNIFNTSDYTNCLAKIGMNDIYKWLGSRPDGFGQFNHPGDYDILGQEFLHFDLYSPAVNQMVGIENWNGNDSFEKYFYASSWNPKFSYMDAGIQKGWRLGSLGSQDNHSKDWGMKNNFRTAVLAKSLTRESIIDAYKNRRFYATEDKDLCLDFRCGGYPMGSVLTGVARTFEVKAADKDGDIFREIRLYKNGNLLEKRVVNNYSVDEIFYDNAMPAVKDYYYVIIQTNADHDQNGRLDEAISSPIWTK